MASMLRPGFVLLADRGFCSFAHLAMLALKKLDAVLRVHQKQLVDFAPNRPHQQHGKKPKRGTPTSRFVRRLRVDDAFSAFVRVRITFAITLIYSKANLLLERHR